MTIKSIRKVKKLFGKKVLLRTDFDVSIKNNRIKDEYRIVQQLPTIRFLLRLRCKIIIVTHLGRPLEKGKLSARARLRGQADRKIKNKEYFTAKPIAKRLSQLLGRNVRFVKDGVSFKAGTEISRMKNGEIIMLENLRFENGEQKNSRILARNLAKLADIYVNDAFAVSHRAHASVSAIKNYLPSYAGLLLEKEIVNLHKVLNPKKPLVIVIGGAKITTKIPLIKKLHKKAERILIGGALANNFFVARGFKVGKSLVDKQSIKFAKSFLPRWQAGGNKNIILPIDVVISNKESGWRAVVKNVNQVGINDYIFDIGPETVRLYANFIKKAKTIIWNGPMGVFEEEKFKHGTLSIARVIASRSTGSAFGVVGGGETIEALKMTKMIDYVDWVSTGGGAMLAFLGGGKMPGLKGIVK